MSSDTEKTTKYSTNITKRSDTAGADGVPITLGLTDTVRDKASRFLDEEWLRYEVCRLATKYPSVPEQEYYRRGMTNEFHLVYPIEDYTIVLLDKYEHIVVVTQMHSHMNYTENGQFTYVDEERWHKRFDNRRAARNGVSESELALHVEDLDEKTRTFPAPSDVATPSIKR